MDYKEEIKKAAEKHDHECMLDVFPDISDAFIDGALSQASKDYWYNEFKAETKDAYGLIGININAKDNPLTKEELSIIKSTAARDYWYEQIALQQEEAINEFTHNRIVPIVGEPGSFVFDREKLMKRLDEIKTSPEYLKDMEYNQYIKDNPERPISFDNWKYMVEHYEKPELISKNDIDDVVNGKRPHYPYGTIQSDPLYGVTKKDFDDATPKHIGIIGHVDHGKTLMVGLELHESQRGVIIMGMDTPLTPEERFDVMKNLKPNLSAIESIVPIADVIPEPFFLTKSDYPQLDNIIESDGSIKWKFKKRKSK